MLFIVFAFAGSAQIKIGTQAQPVMPQIIPGATGRSSAGDIFLADVTGGRKDVRATGHAFTFVAQYLTSGGNIYSVSDFIDQHEELAFLEDAEKVYPEVFEQIKQKRLPHTYSDQGLLAYLAYLEVLEKYGYKGITLDGELSFGYAKHAYYMNMIRRDKKGGRSLTYPDYSDIEIAGALKKATYFGKKADLDTTVILADTTTYKDLGSIPAQNALVHHAAALRILESLHAKFLPANDAEDIFTFAFSLAKRGGVPDAYLSVSLSDASSELLLPDPDPNRILNSIRPVIDTGTNGRTSDVVRGIIDSRYVPSRSRYADLGFQSRTNIKKLATIVPEFKTWLIENGWSEPDFRQ